MLAATALLLVVAPGGTQTGNASSHRDAPLILEDPTADNTDVYAFVSTEPGRSNYFTLISIFIPLEEPGEGPNYYRLSDTAAYNIYVDTTGDAVPEITYTWQFTTQTVNGNTFLYNTGQIQPVANPTNVSEQYPGLNIRQSYTLTEVRTTIGPRGIPQVVSTTLLQNARTAPIRVGPKSLTGTPGGTTTTAYTTLANQAIHTVGTAPNEVKVFVGPRDEGFYVDLMGSFDLINIRNPGVDTTSGFNVHTLAIEIPKSRLAAAGANGKIGVWSAATRPSQRVLQPGVSNSSGNPVQVSRLGNPLVNEVLLPLTFKDRFNGTPPTNDVNIRDFIVNPGTSQGPAALIPLLNSITMCTPTTNRADLELVLLKGIDQATANALAAAVPSLAPFAMAGGNQLSANPTVADMQRLNYNVAPSTTPSPLGFFGGDPAGFPNGRRVGDDVLDIDLKAAAGAILHILGAINCPISVQLSDNVQQNDVPYLTTFPYLGLPHEGYRHAHDHD
jgi:hypothetical protein